MEHHHLVNKVSRFFPSSFSSCRATNSSSVPDVIESAIPIAKTSYKTSPHSIRRPPKQPSIITSRHDPKTLYKNGRKESRFYRKSMPLGSVSEEGSPPPPFSPLLVAAFQEKEKVKETTGNNIKSTSSNSSRWFSSSTEDEAAGFDGKSDGFFTLSSCSSESFRRKRAQSTCTSWRRYDKKAFNDLGRCSSALSAYSVSTALSQCSLERPENQVSFPGKASKTAGEMRQAKETMSVKEVAPEPEDLTELYYGSLGRQKRRQKTGKPRRKRIKKERRRKRPETIRAAEVDPDHDTVVLDDSRVEEGYAVEKTSRDPYGDFSTSMVEMIIEKQIFGAEDLGKLLDCFLSLNSSCYHKLIVQVFMEICDTLFAI